MTVKKVKKRDEASKKRQIKGNNDRKEGNKKSVVFKIKARDTRKAGKPLER